MMFSQIVNTPKNPILYSFIFMWSILFQQSVLAQESTQKKKNGHIKRNNFRTIEVRGQSGAHIYGGESLTDAVSAGYGAFEVRYGWQSNDTTKWNKYYGYPSYGIGYYTGFLGDPLLFGNPNAIYGFINFPLSAPNKKNSFEISPALGVTYNLNPYDPENNPLNDAIGSKINVYFNVNFGFAYRITREMDLTYGVSFSHFSNGRSNIPNLGLNMLGLYLGLRYHYNANQGTLDKDRFTTNVLPARYKIPNRTPMEHFKRQSINVYAAVGSVEASDPNNEGKNNRYMPFSVTLDYQYQWRIMHALTLGMDYFYDPSMEVKFPDEPSKYNMVGIHAGYRYSFWRLAILLQIGTYIENKERKNNIFVRPTFQYHITDKIYAQVGLKTRGPGSADWIEFGIGFTPIKW